MKLLGFLLILGVIWGGSSFVAMIFTSLKAQPHSTLSKLLGMVVAGFKYFLIFALISASLLESNLIRTNFSMSIRTSLVLPTLNRIGSSLMNLTPFTLEVSDPATGHKEKADG
jgi:hypothetical protein